MKKKWKCNSCGANEPCIINVAGVPTTCPVNSSECGWQSTEVPHGEFVHCEDCDFEEGWSYCSRDAKLNQYTDIAEGSTDRSANKDGKCPFFKDEDNG